MPYYGSNNYQNQPMYNNYQQPYQPQPITNPQPYPIRANNLQYGTEEEIKAFILGANSQVMAIDPDPNKPYMYIKSTNAFGQPSFDIFKYEKVNVVSTEKVIVNNDLTPLTSRIEKLEKAFAELTSKSVEKVQGETNG